MDKHGQRYEDFGIGRIFKSYLPIIGLIFTSGALYESVRANAILSVKLQAKSEDHETRITKMEDAVLYLTQIVKDDRRRQ